MRLGKDWLTGASPPDRSPVLPRRGDAGDGGPQQLDPAEFLELLEYQIYEKGPALSKGELTLTLNPRCLVFLERIFREYEETGLFADEFKAFGLVDLYSFFLRLPSLHIVPTVPGSKAPEPMVDLGIFVGITSLQMSDLTLTEFPINTSIQARLHHLAVHGMLDSAAELFPVGGGVWSALQRLDLSRNFLRCLDDSAINGLPCERINLAHNLLSEVPMLDACFGLERLNLSYNRIPDCKEISARVGGVKGLSLRGNDLVSSAGIEFLMALESLDLRDNSLTAWPDVRLLRRLPFLRDLWLLGNPVCHREHYRLDVFRTITGNNDHRETTHMVLDGSPPSRQEAEVLAMMALQAPKEFACPANRGAPVVTMSRSVEGDGLGLSLSKSPRGGGGSNGSYSGSGGGGGKRKKRSAVVKLEEEPFAMKSGSPVKEEATPAETTDALTPIKDLETDEFAERVKRLHEEGGSKWLVILDGLEREAESQPESVEKRKTHHHHHHHHHHHQHSSHTRSKSQGKKQFDSQIVEKTETREIVEPAKSELLEAVSEEKRNDNVVAPVEEPRLAKTPVDENILEPPVEQDVSDSKNQDKGNSGETTVTLDQRDSKEQSLSSDSPRGADESAFVHPDAAAVSSPENPSSNDAGFANDINVGKSDANVKGEKMSKAEKDVGRASSSLLLTSTLSPPASPVKPGPSDGKSDILKSFRATIRQDSKRGLAATTEASSKQIIESEFLVLRQNPNSGDYDLQRILMFAGGTQLIEADVENGETVVTLNTGDLRSVEQIEFGDNNMGPVVRLEFGSHAALDVSKSVYAWRLLDNIDGAKFVARCRALVNANKLAHQKSMKCITCNRVFEAAKDADDPQCPSCGSDYVVNVTAAPVSSSNLSLDAGYSPTKKKEGTKLEPSSSRLSMALGGALTSSAQLPTADVLLNDYVAAHEFDHALEVFLKIKILIEAGSEQVQCLIKTDLANVTERSPLAETEKPMWVLLTSQRFYVLSQAIDKQADAQAGYGLAMVSQHLIASLARVTVGLFMTWIRLDTDASNCVLLSTMSHFKTHRFLEALRGVLGADTLVQHVSSLTASVLKRSVLSGGDVAMYSRVRKLVRKSRRTTMFFSGGSDAKSLIMSSDLIALCDEDVGRWFVHNGGSPSFTAQEKHKLVDVASIVHDGDCVASLTFDHEESKRTSEPWMLEWATPTDKVRTLHILARAWSKEMGGIGLPEKKK